MIVLGLNFAHDGSACLVKDGKLLCAISSERVTRIKKFHGVTPEVINYLSRLAKTARNNSDDAMKLAQSMKFIGLDLAKPSNKNFPDDKDIINLIKQRDEYRIKKDFKSADEVRDKLLDMGVELRDSDGKTTWKYSED